MYYKPQLKYSDSPETYVYRCNRSITITRDKYVYTHESALYLLAISKRDNFDGSDFQ